jgi:hypothetical protein
MSIKQTSKKKRPEKHRPRAPVDLSQPSWRIEEVAAFFGGADPLHPATVYRGVEAGHIPPPYHPSPGLSRWDPDECRAARAKKLAARDPGPGKIDQSNVGAS